MIKRFLGPIPLPFFGNLLSFYFSDIEAQLCKWKNQFGDIQTIWFGNIPVISLHDAPTIFDTFIKNGEIFSGRPHSKMDEIVHLGNYGIVNGDGKRWQKNRNFAMNFFRKNNFMQENILFEVQNLLNDVKKEIKNGGQIVLQNEIDLKCGSIINKLLFGTFYQKENKTEFEKVKTFSKFLLQQLSNPVYRVMESNASFYKRLPYFNSYYNFFTEQLEKAQTYFFNAIEKRRKETDFSSNEEPKDMTAAYLKQQEMLKIQGSNDDSFCNALLYATLLDIWVAGLETTSSTLIWFCIYLIQYPHVQTEISQELDKVIGDSNRLITSDDKVSLHYLNAVIAETQRYCNLVPLNVFHRTTKSTKIQNFDIPANTIITYQISTVHMDDRYFPEPFKFNPERFLKENGKFFQPPELMPFGVGKRACFGEKLARMEVFLFAANLANHFTFCYPFASSTNSAKDFVVDSDALFPISCKLRKA